MKAIVCLVALLALGGAAMAQSTVVIPAPVQSPTVISPLTNPTSQSGQALLGQISNTLSQRAFERQILTLTTQPQAPGVQVAQPIVIAPR